jgi:GGDEF domain-containing protein
MIASFTLCLSISAISVLQLGRITRNSSPPILATVSVSLKQFIKILAALKINLSLSISLGFTVSENNIDTLENMMKKADELMYADKVGKRR